MSKRIVIALGGNALGNTAAEQLFGVQLLQLSTPYKYKNQQKRASEKAAKKGKHGGGKRYIPAEYP